MPGTSSESSAATRYRVERSLGRDALSASFSGHLSTRAGEESAARFAELLREGPTAVVLDLREMTGYDSGARRAWQRTMLPHSHLILSLEVLGGSAMMRMGALVLATAWGVPMKGH